MMSSRWLLAGKERKFEVNLYDVRRLQKAVSYQKAVRSKLASEVAASIGKKEQGLVKNLWNARTALTAPTMPSRELREWFRTVSLDSSVVASHDYIERARDAFCQHFTGFAHTTIGGDYPDPRGRAACCGGTRDTAGCQGVRETSAR